jgi:ABC-type multidrug transport system ATPase subunit
MAVESAATGVQKAAAKATQVATKTVQAATGQAAKAAQSAPKWAAQLTAQAAQGVTAQRTVGPVPASAPTDAPADSNNSTGEPAAAYGARSVQVESAPPDAAPELERGASGMFGQLARTLGDWFGGGTAQQGKGAVETSSSNLFRGADGTEGADPLTRTSTRRQEDGSVAKPHSVFPHANDFVHLKLDGVSFHIRKARVLHDLHASIREGELCALMGESGSGKSTLLNVLGGRGGYGKVSGTISLNNKPFDPTRVKLGFVPQAYLIFKELTVHENLLYAAMLRLDRQYSNELRAEIVDSALELLGLSKVRDFLCDKALTSQRLSGGQVRRVGIGVELVTLPRLLLLDEPTSALDAVNTRLVVQVLKLLAERGILVIASLHQPRFSVYMMIDKLLVLRQGELILADTREPALPFFAQNGFVPAEGENPADFFIEVAFGFMTSTNQPPVHESELPAKVRERIAEAAAADEAERRAQSGVCTYKEFSTWFAARHGVMFDSGLCRSVWDRASAVHAVELQKYDEGTAASSQTRKDEHTAERERLEMLKKQEQYEQQLTSRESAAGASHINIFKAQKMQLHHSETVPWDLLRQLIDNWQIHAPKPPRIYEQFGVCSMRYALKLIRTRKALASRCALRGEHIHTHRLTNRLSQVEQLTPHSIGHLSPSDDSNHTSRPSRHLASLLLLAGASSS